MRASDIADFIASALPSYTSRFFNLIICNFCTRMYCGKMFKIVPHTRAGRSTRQEARRLWKLISRRFPDLDLEPEPKTGFVLPHRDCRSRVQSRSDAALPRCQAAGVKSAGQCCRAAAAPPRYLPRGCSSFRPPRGVVLTSFGAAGSPPLRVTPDYVPIVFGGSGGSPTHRRDS